MKAKKMKIESLKLDQDASSLRDVFTQTEELIDTTLQATLP